MSRGPSATGISKKSVKLRLSEDFNLEEMGISASHLWDRGAVKWDFELVKLGLRRRSRINHFGIAHTQQRS
jgi:hypothetical protein